GFAPTQRCAPRRGGAPATAHGARVPVPPRRRPRSSPRGPGRRFGVNGRGERSEAPSVEGSAPDGSLSEDLLKGQADPGVNHRVAPGEGGFVAERARRGLVGQAPKTRAPREAEGPGVR